MPPYFFRLEKSSGFCHTGAFQLALASLAATTGVKSAAYSMGRWRFTESLEGLPRILLLPCSGNILYFRSEAGRTMSGRKPTFLLAPVGVYCGPAMVGESLRGFGENPRRCRAGGAFGRPGNR